MRGGVSSWICLASLAAGGCASTQTGELKVRAIPDAAAKLRPGSGLLADATAQLALGNVGLAIEGFRKALREQPNSAEAYAGLAKCYEAMGRYDLARSNYESALALTPQDPGLLTAVAVALDQQGQTEAADVAREQAAAITSAAKPQVPQPRIDSPARVATGSSVTVQLPPARRPDVVALASSVRVDLPPPRPVSSLPTAPAEIPLPQPRTNRAAAVALGATDAVRSMGDEPEKLAGALASNIDLSTPPVRPTWTPLAPPRPEVVLPRPRTNQPAAVALGPTNAVQSPDSWSSKLIRALASSIDLDIPLRRRLSEVAPQPIAKPREPERGPYLERLSPGEVALVTDGRPAWRAHVVAQNRTSTTVRWVPLMMAEARPNIRILNAAQRQGIAANARSVLLDRGWRKIQIGNASELRERSIVFYPASRRSLGRSLAAQFGFQSQMRKDVGTLVVLLGRDSRPGVTKRRG